MNREILFKAKRIDNGEWVEGYFYKIWNDCYIMWGMSNTMPSMIEVEPDTICQYIGLTDKNGNKIWENDICEMVFNGIVCTYQIIFDKSELDFKGTNGKEEYGRDFQYLCCCEEIEVIGNIFDNSELLGYKV